MGSKLVDERISFLLPVLKNLSSDNKQSIEMHKNMSPTESNRFHLLWILLKEAFLALRSLLELEFVALFFQIEIIFKNIAK